MRETTDGLYAKLLYGNLPALILALAADRPMHGYAIRRELIERTAGLIAPSFGRLYPLLRALERRGFLARRQVKAGPARVRAVYTITHPGRIELSERRFRWRRLSAAVNRLLPPDA